MRRLFSLFFVSLAVSGQPLAIEGERLRAHIRFLANDLLEGRAVGTRGGQLATQYLASAFEAAGAQAAGDDGTFFQRVPLTGVLVDPASSLSIGGKSLAWRTNFVGTTQTQEESVRFSAALVFVGHGIKAPEFGWDDYAGADVKGKIVVLFTGEPPSGDPAFFDGKALTYYGRWTYKFEEAARQGAAGAIILHTDETASYGWSVVENSWAREDIQLERAAADVNLRFAAWISTAAARLAGLKVEEMLALADQKGFVATPLPQMASVALRAKVRKIESQNVAAHIAGSEPKAEAEHIIYSAHWDHLGTGSQGEDRIFNGAVDNATGCAMLVEFARAWAALSPRPRRSVVFLAVTGEESGLRGSEYYVRHPLFPLAAAKLNINMDGILPGGQPGGLLALGEDKTKAWPLLEEAARRFGLPLRADPRPEAGSAFRSDHFSFVKAGVSAFSLIPVDVPGDFARSYNGKHYHQPSDEYTLDWELTSLESMANLALVFGVNMASRP